MNNQTVNDKSEIDLLRLLRVLWHRAWLVVLVMLLLGAIAFSYAFFFITPTYQATAMMYVNNNSISSSVSEIISSSQLTAAKGLLETYVVILKSRTTLEQVIDEAGLNYSYAQLNGMVSASSVNETEIFSIDVTSTDPVEAATIANTIVKVLPDRISDVIEKANVRTVDEAVIPVNKAAPSLTKYAIIGMLIGAVITCAFIIVLDMMDTTMRGEEYLTQNYPDIPVLAIVPDMYESKKRPYSYYYSSYGRSSSKSRGKK